MKTKYDELRAKVMQALNKQGNWTPQEVMDGLADAGSPMALLGLLDEIDRLAKALRPFAEMADTGFVGTGMEGRAEDTSVVYHHGSGKECTVGDFKEAARVYAKIQGE